MNYLQACHVFTKMELRLLAKVRSLRWYSYLNKRELSFRLFGDNPQINRILCNVNQMRRYGIPQPDDPLQWT